MEMHIKLNLPLRGSEDKRSTAGFPPDNKKGACTLSIEPVS